VAEPATDDLRGALVLVGLGLVAGLLGGVLAGLLRAPRAPVAPDGGQA
jgi:hypothetical protein